MKRLIKYISPPPPFNALFSVIVLSLAFGLNPLVAQSTERCEVLVGFERGSYVVFEGSEATLTVQTDFSGPLDDNYTLDVNFSTDDVMKWQGQSHSGLSGQGGASEGVDYQSREGTLTFDKNSPRQTISIPITADDQSERFERFYVNLEIPYTTPSSTHKTSEQVCSQPATLLKRYGFSATVHIRD